MKDNITPSLLLWELPILPSSFIFIVAPFFILEWHKNSEIAKLTETIKQLKPLLLCLEVTCHPEVRRNQYSVSCPTRHRPPLNVLQIIRGG